MELKELAGLYSKDYDLLTRLRKDRDKILSNINEVETKIKDYSDSLKKCVGQNIPKRVILVDPERIVIVEKECITYHKLDNGVL